MSVHESAHVFDGPDGPLVGVLSHPRLPSATALLIIVGGPQYRVGSHRQFVQLARSVADKGHAVLRFDYRGMGDSAGDMPGFENVDADVAAAIDFMFAALPGLQRVVLWGLCDGASAALMYCQRRQDPRVAGLCLANPWVRSAQTLARTHVKHYYLQRLREPEFWRKLVSGGVAWAALRGLLSNLRAARQAGTIRAGDGPGAEPSSYQARMAMAWRDRRLPLLLLLSGDDYTAKEFTETVAIDPNWHGALERVGLNQHLLEDADHTFSASAHQRRAEALTCAWLASWLPAPQAKTAGPGE